MDSCLAVDIFKSSDLVLFLVTAKIENSKMVKGVRSRIYRLAHIGYYDQNHQNSIYYDDRSCSFQVGGSRYAI
jgi:hypothetical protein